MGSLEVQLAEKVTARQLAALLDVANTAYLRGISEATQLSSNGALWIDLLEIGTPNRLTLGGLMDGLRQVALAFNLLGAALGGAAFAIHNAGAIVHETKELHRELFGQTLEEAKKRDDASGAILPQAVLKLGL
jgi:hypothetical protein